jgi:hypothetical protein
MGTKYLWYKQTVGPRNIRSNQPTIIEKQLGFKNNRKSVHFTDGFLLVAGLGSNFNPLNGEQGPRILEIKEKSVILHDGFLLVAGLGSNFNPLNGEQGPRIPEIKEKSVILHDGFLLVAGLGFEPRTSGL